MEPLFIFLDLEAAHGNNYFGDIIEIAAQVDPRVLKAEIFSSLINTKQNLSYFALKISKITRQDLAGKKYFPDVFKEFIKWISNVVSKSNEFKRKQYYPVLVAHGGFDNDFMMIQSNLERNDISLEILKKLHFADTYILAKHLKGRDVQNLWKCQLSIEKMFQHFFPDEKFIGQHRALPDVKYMIDIFLKSPLKNYFHEISIAAFDARYDEYTKRNTSKVEKEILNEKLPKNLAKVIHNMTLTRLLRNGLTYTRLVSLFEGAQSTFDFYDKLKDVGIERKASKPMAAHLLSMGFCCRGVIETEERLEAGDVVNTENSTVPTKTLAPVRTDSGYNSLDYNLDEEEKTLFYEMFVDEFFYPPETYQQLQFGSFTVAEIREMDDYIDDVFEELFGVDDYGEYSLNGNSDAGMIKNVDCMKMMPLGTLPGIDGGKNENANCKGSQGTDVGETSDASVLGNADCMGKMTLGTDYGKDPVHRSIDEDEKKPFVTTKEILSSKVSHKMVGDEKNPFVITNEIPSSNVNHEMKGKKKKPFATKGTSFSKFKNEVKEEKEKSFVTKKKTFVTNGISSSKVSDEKKPFVATKEIFSSSVEEGEENWEDDMDGEVEFHLPSPVKNIPIGMTMNDVSGRHFEEKTPLFKHFNAFDVAAVPEGGLPEMSGKQRRHQKWKSKKEQRKQQKLLSKQPLDPSVTSGSGRIYGKTDSGEIIILV